MGARAGEGGGESEQECGASRRAAGRHGAFIIGQEGAAGQTVPVDAGRYVSSFPIHFCTSGAR